MSDCCHRLTPVPEGFGCDDYESPDGAGFRLEALAAEGCIGYVEFYDRGDDLRIVYVQAWRPRRGIATALLDELVRLHPGKPLVTHGFTDEGQAFAAAYAARGGMAISEVAD